MNTYTDLEDINDLQALIQEGRNQKKAPLAQKNLGQHKTLAMLFFNSSLRTRLSTQKAARNLGMEVMVINFNQDGWQLEFEDGTVMNADKAEHIKEAAAVISQYADLIGLRAFPSLKDREKDYSEILLKSFAKYATVPVINMESATAHPLQALADAITIEEQKNTPNPKVVLTWAPHPKALPQAVPNSFVKMMKLMGADLTITHPHGYDLAPEIVGNVPVFHNQEEALKGADFVYAKNWSSYQDYGQVLSQDENWMVTMEKLGKAKFMHCLPVRRNVVVEDAVLDSTQSLVIEQANNRTWAAQAVLKELLTK
ncbi:N-acetylornithine carbamoyltransferase [Robertkochia marina]|uniref:N-succinylornithine carbamoyltransferase n=1 Tax=Robertkochia marina TaxID=1227945 RepID=A0A4S3M387_9FLAO|nr:N-acetylornithine carbamoyltransferase [Robertkochia marina]THD68109.1 N-acetylornithine carbamoyltransferase [Robertkochia marina]TRZ43461.1 N-acetylornithine carbamoyltransferase [Robertkochia marina]